MIWNWWAVPGTLAFIAGVGAAFTALRTNPRRSLNQRLAAVLVFDSFLFGFGSGTIFFFESAPVVRAMAVLSGVAVNVLPFLYLTFMGAALDVPFLRPFRSQRAFLILGLLSVVAGIVVLLRPHLFVTPLYQPAWAPWNFQSAEWGNTVALIFGLLEFVALGAAIWAYRRTPVGSSARSQAKWFVIAFGVRDAYFMFSLALYPQLRPIPFWGDLIYNPIQASLYFVFVLLLSYGVLHTQLLDIELRIKLALQRSTVIGAVAAVFLIGSAVLEQLLPVQSKLISVVLAISLALAFSRLERMTKRVVDRIMPGVEKSEAYLGTRRIEVYRAALEGAAQDGIVTRREQDILAALRRKLNITDDEADIAEREFRNIMTDVRPTTQRIAV